jgi:hypothetical protein
MRLRLALMFAYRPTTFADDGFFLICMVTW